MNQKQAYIYLNCSHIDSIEATLSSLQSRSFYEQTRSDAKLFKMATEIALAQEEQLGANLKAMSYLIRTPADIIPITGAERVEMV